MKKMKFVIFNSTGDFHSEYFVGRNFAQPLIETIALYSKPPYTTVNEEPTTPTKEDNDGSTTRSSGAKPGANATRVAAKQQG